MFDFKANSAVTQAKIPSENPLQAVNLAGVQFCPDAEYSPDDTLFPIESTHEITILERLRATSPLNPEIKQLDLFGESMP